MKKYILALILLCMAGLGIHGQTGIGARGLFGMDGNAYGGIEFSIQRPAKFELDLGVIGESWKATGVKLVPFVDRENFGVYGGYGLGLGSYDDFNELYGTFALDLGTYLMLGKLQTGLDWRPEWNFFNSPRNDLSFNLALSFRWMFGK